MLTRDIGGTAAAGEAADAITVPVAAHHSRAIIGLDEEARLTDAVIEATATLTVGTVTAGPHD